MTNQAIAAAALILTFIGCGTEESPGDTPRALSEGQGQENSTVGEASLEVCEEAERSSVKFKTLELAGTILTATLDATGSCPTYKACWDQSFREEVPALAVVHLLESAPGRSCELPVQVDLAAIEQAFAKAYPTSAHGLQVSLDGWSQPILLKPQTH